MGSDQHPVSGRVRLTAPDDDLVESGTDLLSPRTRRRHAGRPGRCESHPVAVRRITASKLPPKEALPSRLLSTGAVGASHTLDAPLTCPIQFLAGHCIPPPPDRDNPATAPPACNANCSLRIVASRLLLTPLSDGRPRVQSHRRGQDQDCMGRRWMRSAITHRPKPGGPLALKLLLLVALVVPTSTAPTAASVRIGRT